MPRRTLNLGIVAHVDAGKTTLTERLLYTAGVIDRLGSVDAGTTQTDSLALEQQRGITIKSAVVSFAVDDVTVNLLDTPGHPDFIAEVERVLSVLDGSVLVISGVEGVQPQTRILMRALERLRIPTLLFVNKIDRPGADPERVVAQIRDRLTPAVVAIGSVRDAGTRGAEYAPHADGDAEFTSRLVELLSDDDDALLAEYVDDDRGIAPSRLRAALAAQTKRAVVHPVLFGSALTGAGVPELMGALPRVLPSEAGDPEAPISAGVFKVERGPSGEKITYARIFAGTIRVRDRVSFGGDRRVEADEAKVTAIAAFDGGLAARADSVGAGQIGKLWGLREVQIGDTIGTPGPRLPARLFAPPMLESVVAPTDPAESAALYAALTQLAEQDPLIDVRRDAVRQELAVSLYGEVQKEVVEATLTTEYGLDVTFRETTPIYVERPTGVGDAVEILHAESNPFLATLGFRVEPASPDSGLEFRLDVDPRTLPLYVFKTLDAFRERMDEYVRSTLREGLFGWQVTDCVVTLSRCEYSVPDGPPSRRGPLSTAADFRKLTPIVVMQALARAGTVVCEPMVSGRLEIPSASIGVVIGALVRLGAGAETSATRRELAVIETLLPAARVHELQRQLAGLTGGEGVLETTFAGYQPVRGEQPARERTRPNPLDLDDYLRQFTGVP